MRETIVFSVHDLKVYPITDVGDDATDPTYGAPVDVPGVNEVGLDPEITSATLRGDGKVIDARSALDQLSLSFAYAKLDLDVLAVLDGGTVSTGTGTGDPADKDRYVRNADDLIPEWGAAALISEVDNPGAAAKLYVYRARVNGGTLFAANDNEYGSPSFDAAAIALPKGAHYAIDLEGTATALPATGAALIATYAALT